MLGLALQTNPLQAQRCLSQQKLLLVIKQFKSNLSYITHQVF